MSRGIGIVANIGVVKVCHAFPLAGRRHERGDRGIGVCHVVVRKKCWTRYLMSVRSNSLRSCNRKSAAAGTTKPVRETSRRRVLGAVGSVGQSTGNLR